MAKRNDAIDTIQEIRSLQGESRMLYFRLGELLAELRDERRGSGLRFDAKYVNKTFQLSYGTAMYLIRIYERFSAAGIGERRLHGLEWSKAKEIARLHPPKLRVHFDRLYNRACRETRQSLIEHIQDKFVVDRRGATTG
jgi:hypothetical protein